MRKLAILWGFLIVLISTFLLFIGINASKKFKDYKSFENDIVEAVKVYSGLEENLSSLPKKGESIKITFKQLIESNLLINTQVNGDNCVGYGVIKGKSVSYDYEAYIKCSNYETEGYKD